MWWRVLDCLDLIITGCEKNGMACRVVEHCIRLHSTLDAAATQMPASVSLDRQKVSLECSLVLSRHFSLLILPMLGMPMPSLLHPTSIFELGGFVSNQSATHKEPCPKFGESSQYLHSSLIFEVALAVNPQSQECLLSNMDLGRLPPTGPPQLSGSAVLDQVLNTRASTGAVDSCDVSMCRCACISRASCCHSRSAGRWTASLKTGNPSSRR